MIRKTCYSSTWNKRRRKDKGTTGEIRRGKDSRWSETDGRRPWEKEMESSSASSSLREEKLGNESERHGTKTLLHHSIPLCRERKEGGLQSEASGLLALSRIISFINSLSFHSFVSIFMLRSPSERWGTCMRRHIFVSLYKEELFNFNIYLQFRPSTWRSQGCLAFWWYTFNTKLSRSHVSSIIQTSEPYLNNPKYQSFKE